MKFNSIETLSKSLNISHATHISNLRSQINFILFFFILTINFIPRLLFSMHFNMKIAIALLWILVQ